MDYVGNGMYRSQCLTQQRIGPRCWWVRGPWLTNRQISARHASSSSLRFIKVELPLNVEKDVGLAGQDCLEVGLAYRAVVEVKPGLQQQRINFKYYQIMSIKIIRPHISFLLLSLFIITKNEESEKVSFIHYYYLQS